MAAILFLDGKTVLHIIYFSVVYKQQKYISIKLSFREFDSPYFELIWREMWGSQELVLVNKLHYYTCKLGMFSPKRLHLFLQTIYVLVKEFILLQAGAYESNWF